jgi:hypothetical protein
MLRTGFRKFRNRCEVVYRGVVTFATALRAPSRTGKPITKAGEYWCRRCREHGHFDVGRTFPTCVKDNHSTIWFWRGPYRG